MQQPTIAFIGAGNIASSLIGGLINSGYSSNKIFASSPNLDKLIALKTKFQINISESNLIAAKSAEVIILCVKPNKIADVVKELSKIINPQQLILSIAAGITLQQIKQWLVCESPIIRCMPNTPTLIAAGATGLFANEIAKETHRQFAESLMRLVGIIVWVETESQLDIITALSGSGPAYFLFIFEALVEAAQTLGLAEDKAKLLTLQTALGTARMALESKNSLTELCQKVTSPGGTTEAALRVLFDNNINKTLFSTLEAATQRAAEMSSLFAVGTNKALEQKSAK